MPPLPLTNRRHAAVARRHGRLAVTAAAAWLPHSRSASDPPLGGGSGEREIPTYARIGVRRPCRRCLSHEPRGNGSGSVAAALPVSLESSVGRRVRRGKSLPT